MIESILVATDGSEAAGAAERLAVSLASRLRARISGVSVVEDRDARPPADDGLSLPSFPGEAVAAYYKARAEAAAQRLSERARREELELACDVTAGIADDRIVERAQGADVVVLGRDGKHAAARTALIGSTANGVIRKTAKSALVVPSGAPLAGPVVLGFDGSPGSRVAANLAVQIAGTLGEPVHVFVDSKDKGRAVARFDEVRQLVGSLQVPVRENSSTLGRPDVKIVDCAREARAGLIVMGAFGRNRITEYFVGSNATTVARNSPVAVLLAR